MSEHILEGLGVNLRGGLAKSTLTISGLHFSLFWNSFLSGICKLRRENEKSGECLHSKLAAADSGDVMCELPGRPLPKYFVHQ